MNPKLITRVGPDWAMSTAAPMAGKYLEKKPSNDST